MLTHDCIKALLHYCCENKATVTFSFSESFPGSLKVDLKYDWPAHRPHIFIATIVFDNWDLEMMNPDECQQFIKRRIETATREVYDAARKGSKQWRL